MADRDKILDQFFGDATTPIEWASDEEKKLHFWLDDLHCPQPISPMWFDIGGWWLTLRLHVSPVRRAVRQGLGRENRQRLPDERGRAERGRGRSRVVGVLQHGDAGLRRQVPRLVEAALPAGNPPQLRVSRHVSDGVVVAARVDDPARRGHRHPGAPLAAALDAQPRAVSGVDYVRERSHSHRRRPSTSRLSAAFSSRTKTATGTRCANCGR